MTDVNQKKLVEIKPGVFRDPDEVYISARTGAFIQWSKS